MRFGVPEAGIAGGYRLDSQSIFSQMGRSLLTAPHVDRNQGYGSPKEKAVKGSMRDAWMPVELTASALAVRANDYGSVEAVQILRYRDLALQESSRHV
jgi:hypothetical protein